MLEQCQTSCPFSVVTSIQFLNSHKSFVLLFSTTRKYNDEESQERHKKRSMARTNTPLHIFALGPPEVRLGENLVSFPTRKTLALLIYLAIELVCSRANIWLLCYGQKRALSAAMPTFATPSTTCKQPCD